MQFEEMINKVHCTSCLDFMKNIPDNSIDLILTDPPYGINYHSNCSNNEKYRKNVADTVDWDGEFVFPFEEFMRILKNNSACFVFSTWKNLYNFPKPDDLLIWDKMDFGMGDLSCWSPSYEVILFFKKGKFKLRGARERNILSFFKVANFSVRDNNKNKMFHPTEKPVKLISFIIEKSSDRGGVVLDPFLGSGTTAVACKMLNRRFIGIELSPDYCKIAEQRIKAVPERLDKFLK